MKTLNIKLTYLFTIMGIFSVNKLSAKDFEGKGELFSATLQESPAINHLIIRERPCIDLVIQCTIKKELLNICQNKKVWQTSTTFQTPAGSAIIGGTIRKQNFDDIFSTLRTHLNGIDIASIRLDTSYTETKQGKEYRNSYVFTFSEGEISAIMEQQIPSVDYRYVVQNSLSRLKHMFPTLLHGIERSAFALPVRREGSPFTPPARR